jgi:hypothetical protein
LNVSVLSDPLLCQKSKGWCMTSAVPTRTLRGLNGRGGVGAGLDAVFTFDLGQALLDIFPKWSLRPPAWADGEDERGVCNNPWNAVREARDKG